MLKERKQISSANWNRNSQLWLQQLSLHHPGSNQHDVDLRLYDIDPHQHDFSPQQRDVDPCLHDVVQTVHESPLSAIWALIISTSGMKGKEAHQCQAFSSRQGEEGSSFKQWQISVYREEGGKRSESPMVARPISLGRRDSSSTPAPKIKQAVKMVDENAAFCDSIAEFMTDNQDFLVVGICGLQVGEIAFCVVF